MSEIYEKARRIAWDESAPETERLFAQAIVALWVSNDERRSEIVALQEKIESLVSQEVRP